MHFISYYQFKENSQVYRLPAPVNFKNREENTKLSTIITVCAVCSRQTVMQKDSIEALHQNFCYSYYYHFVIFVIMLTGMLTGRGQTRRLDGLQGQRTQLSIKRPIDCLLSLDRLFLKEFNDEAVTD